MIEQHDQIKVCGFKSELGGVSYKKFEFDIQLKSSLTELSDRHVGNVYHTNLPAPACQP